MEDQRFLGIKKDPKFRRVPKAQSKIKIDNRFKSMFTDEKFQVKYSVDKRGRPVNHHSKEDLERYYEISSPEESEDESDSDADAVGNANQADSDSLYDKRDVEDSEKSKNDAPKPSKYDKKLADNVKSKLRDLNIDFARGEQKICSDSSSDDEETDEEVDKDEIDHRWGELDADADSTNEVTNRLAACNLDWDRIRAVDIMVLLNSFLPPGGVIHSVVIYPSEFGKQRMKEEDIKGPIELVRSKKETKSNDEDNEEGSDYHMEKLRQYQLNRLKYYYAVVTFDSGASANKVYTECDGLEYESSATKMDLRFVPDDMTFDDQPKESCEKLPDKYQPRFFTTSALQQAKVNLTWDETNPDRLEFAEKLNSGKIDDLDVNDFQNYLAGSSSEEEEEENGNSDAEQDQDAVSKYKALLNDIKDKESKKKKDVQLEISWGINLKEKTDELVKKKEEKCTEKTPFEKYIEKRKQKRKEKRNKKKNEDDNSANKNSGSESDTPSGIDMNDPYFAEEFDNSEFSKPKSKKSKQKNKKTNGGESHDQDDAELELLADDIEGGRKHFSLKKILDKESDKKSKNKKKSKQTTTKNEQDEFQVDVEDNRFSALFTSHHYNIDPSDPHYKKTKAMETLIQEKLKRRNVEVSEEKLTAKKPKSELNMLVKSVKRKASAFKNK